MTWDACTMEPNTWLRWIECHPAFLSMIQGIGTFLAILATVLIPFLIRQREERFETDTYRSQLREIFEKISGLGHILRTFFRIIFGGRSPEIIEADAREAAEDIRSLLNILQRTSKDYLFCADLQAALVQQRAKVEKTCAILIDRLHEPAETLSAELEGTMQYALNLKELAQKAVQLIDDLGGDEKERFRRAKANFEAE